MKENVKRRIILILSLLTIIFFISSINSYQNLARQKKAVDQERHSRMQLEEKMLSLIKRSADLKQRLDQLQERFNQEISKLKDELEAEPKLEE